MAGALRHPGLDALRGLAILAVVAGHFTVRWAGLVPFSAPFAPGWQAGRLGVELFFMVSGAVVPMALQRAGAARFLYRRLARLYPVFLVATALTAAVVSVAGPAAFAISAADIWATPTLAPGLFGARFIDGAAWSLVVEARFYALAALAWWLWGRQFWIGIAALALVAGAASLFGAPLIGSAVGGPWLGVFLVGIAAWLTQDGRRGEAAWCAVAALAACAAGLPALVVLGEPAWITTGVLAASGAAVFSAPACHARLLAPLICLGRVSYALYLVHQKIGVTLLIALLGAGLTDGAALLLASLAVLALGIVLHRGIERPAEVWLRTREAALFARLSTLRPFLRRHPA